MSKLPFDLVFYLGVAWLMMEFHVSELKLSLFLGVLGDDLTLISLYLGSGTKCVMMSLA